MKRANYQHGDIINGIKFIEEIKPKRWRKILFRRALFECRCGIKFKCLITSISTGNTKSCGCYGALSRSKRFTKHGLRRHELYGRWTSIKTRCYNKNRSDYKYYGGRGITLSDEFHDFKIWFEYVSSLDGYNDRKKFNLTIDRIDNNQNYERGNLRWATKHQQNINTQRHALSGS